MKELHKAHAIEEQKMFTERKSEPRQETPE
jgi:hypothetical protein